MADILKTDLLGADRLNEAGATAAQGTVTPAPAPAPTPTPTPAPVPEPDPAIGMELGLDTTWYGTVDLSGPIINQEIIGPVDLTLPDDTVSARLTGFITFAQAGTYDLRVTVDDGVRLYLAGSLILDEWRKQGATAFQTASIIADAAQRMPFVMEYFNSRVPLPWIGSAVLKLEWRRNGGAWSVVPLSALSHAVELPVPVPIPEPEPTPIPIPIPEPVPPPAPTIVSFVAVTVELLTDGSSQIVVNGIAVCNVSKDGEVTL